MELINLGFLVNQDPYDQLVDKPTENEQAFCCACTSLVLV